MGGDLRPSGLKPPETARASTAMRSATVIADHLDAGEGLAAHRVEDAGAEIDRGVAGQRPHGRRHLAAGVDHRGDRGARPWRRRRRCASRRRWW
jgi:hypothetical protein